MAIAGDTFTDANGTSLVSHTPTGPNAGSGWGAFGSSAAQIQSNAAQDSNSSSGNRFRMNNDLGSDEMDVEGVFTTPGGTFVFLGLMGRLQGSGTADGFEFTYDYAVGGWNLTDSGSNTDTLVEAWPGGAVTMKLEIRSGVAKGYVNGVEKVSISSSALAGRNYAGILLGNFDGSSPKATVDDFVATGIVAAPAYLPDRPRMHAQLAQ